MYRVMILLCSCLFVAYLLGQTTPLPSALESDPSGGVNLLADKSMKEWIRTPLGANPVIRAGDLKEPSPWKLDGDILTCEGGRVGHEMLRYSAEIKDFILHVEYRFMPVEGETRYNSGVFVRANAEGTIWHQAQATLPGGYFLMNTPVKGVPQRINLQKEMKENRVKPAGEWNVYEVRGVGKQISLWVNGAVVNEYSDCEVPSGYIALEAEGYNVQFRNVQLKRIP
jgi:hypothetical protein